MENGGKLERPGSDETGRTPVEKRFDRSTASRNRDFKDVSCIFYDFLHCTYLRFLFPPTRSAELFRYLLVRSIFAGNLHFVLLHILWS
jgi:hypothetical protein